MTRLPHFPLLNADLVETGRTWRAWSALGSVVLDESAEWLAQADGSKQLGELLDSTPDKLAALALLQTLASAGLLLEAQPATESPTRTPGIAVVGHGPLARDICFALASQRVQVALVTDADRAGWHHAWPASAVAQLCQLEHWSQLAPAHARMVVVASDACEPDRAVLHHLLSQQIPHVVARAHRQCASVGPLWTRAGDACSGCVDQAILSTDADWGEVVLALSRREARPDAQISLAAAALSVHMINSGRAGILTLIQPTGLRHQTWPQHPLCRCAARADSATRELSPLGRRADRRDQQAAA